MISLKLSSGMDRFLCSSILSKTRIASLQALIKFPNLLIPLLQILKAFLKDLNLAAILVALL
jgi:hypothetical protein